MYKPIDLSIFPKERETVLRSIKRFAYFETMLYRSNDWEHIQRVLWLTEAIIPLAKKYLDFDPEKARAYALVHDDAEIVTGDVQAIAKLRMTKQEVKKLEAQENKAIRTLIEKYPKRIHGYSYRELLQEAVHKDSIESQLVSYVDKLDGYCEGLHEVYAGNMLFTRTIVFYTRALTLFPYKFSKLKEFLADKTSPLTYITDQVSPFDIRHDLFKHLGKPHTAQSIKKKTDFPFYNAWREVIIKNGGKEGKKMLLEQKEFKK